MHAEKQNDFNDHDEMNECNEGMHGDEEGVAQNRDGRAEDILEGASDNSACALNSVEQQRVLNQNCKQKNAGRTVQTFVDNKRKNAGGNVQTFVDDKRKNAGGTVQTFVDNKRKQLEKYLSAAQ